MTGCKTHSCPYHACMSDDCQYIEVLEAYQQQIAPWPTYCEKELTRRMKFYKENEALHLFLIDFDQDDDQDFDDDNDGLEDQCPNCGRYYDEIDREYQICHICNYNNTP